MRTLLRLIKSVKIEKKSERLTPAEWAAPTPLRGRFSKYSYNSFASSITLLIVLEYDYINGILLITIEYA